VLTCCYGDSAAGDVTPDVISAVVMYFARHMLEMILLSTETTGFDMENDTTTFSLAARIGYTVACIDIPIHVAMSELSVSICCDPTQFNPIELTTIFYADRQTDRSTDRCCQKRYLLAICAQVTQVTCFFKHNQVIDVCS